VGLTVDDSEGAALVEGVAEAATDDVTEGEGAGDRDTDTAGVTELEALGELVGAGVLLVVGEDPKEGLTEGDGSTDAVALPVAVNDGEMEELPESDGETEPLTEGETGEGEIVLDLVPEELTVPVAEFVAEMDGVGSCVRVGVGVLLADGATPSGRLRPTS
jgi:hypothetical protein